MTAPDTYLLALLLNQPKEYLLFEEDGLLKYAKALEDN